MKRATLLGLMIPAVMMITGAIVPAWAQEEGDAPDHAVARVSLVNGEVSVAHGDSGDMVAASPNAPMVAGDRILTGDNARAEVQFDGANLMRVAPGSEVRMGDLQYHRYLVQVAQGMVMFRVLQDTDAQVEISTPSVSLRPRRQGIYRVVVRPDGSSELTVRSGDAEIFAPTGSEPLGAGQSVISRGSANDPEFQNVNPPAYDEWDRWSADRDRVFERSAESSRYVSPDVYGTEDLNNYGRWTNDPDYGNVWVPTVDADWAPYRLGRWTWVDYYGWSWVSYDPWGWAPYHYGRWYRGNSGWAWYPGTYGARQYWRPALVGFFGWGSPGFGSSGFGASFGFGNVGWVPLAPYEVYRPWYGRGYSGRGVTIVNNTNIVNVYRNGRYTNGVTSMRAGDFGRGAIRSNTSFVRASGADLGRSGLMQGAMPFTPSREGRQFVSRDVNTRGMPQTNNNMRFFSAQRGQGGSFNQGAASQGAGFQGAPQGGQDRGGFRRFDGGAPNNGGGSVAPRQDSGFRRFDGAGSNGQNNDNFGQGGFRRPGGNDGNPQRGAAAQRLDTPQNPQGFTGGGRPNFEQARPLDQNRPGNVQNLDRAPQAPPSQNRGFGGGFGGGGFGSAREQQPVRIAPPIVTNRSEYRNEYRAAPPSAAPQGGNGPGFGGARPNFGGGQPSAPPSGGGGGFRGNPGGNSGGNAGGGNQGGGQRGGGGGGGQRGGGGGNGGHGGGRGR